ncbi:MAG: leucine-rich repeat domain-containing protein, partial [Ruminococcaceae bacterium]|nr:leucine-rich repeat domain-containing protein [Oscillospiraceae bacterium]
MAKKILSWVLALSLLLTCFSGIALVSLAEEAELPTPYIWLTVDQATGEVTASRQAQLSGIDPYVSTEIPGGNGYGLKLQNEEGVSDWQGFWIGTDALLGNNLESATLLVEYYVDSAVKTGEQYFRLMPTQWYEKDGTKAEAEVWYDYYTDGIGWGNPGCDCVLLDKTDVVVYNYTKEELAALSTHAIALGVKGCGGTDGGVYIKSLKVVDSKYVASANPGYAFTEFGVETPVSGYYPNITAEAAYNMTWADLEEGAWRYIKVFGPAQANDPNVDKPVYIKVYAAEGHENDTVSIGSIDATDGNGGFVWSNGKSINMTNGVGGAFVSAGMLNRLNSAGSMRLYHGSGEPAKISRIEVYDVATYCTEAAATEEMTAFFHDYMMDNNYGLTIEGAVEPTGANKGNTGLVVCNACGETLANYEEYYKDPYATLDVSTGAIENTGSIAAQGGAGSIEPKLIPGTDEYGFRLDADWSGFYFGGTLLKNVPAGQSVTVAVEYYIDIAFGATDRHQLFRYQVNGMDWKDMFSNTDKLASQRTALFFHTLTAEEVAAIGAGDFRVTILGCAAGATNTYIKSVKIINSEFVNPIDYTDKGYSVIDVEGKELCPVYYPGLKVPYAVNGSGRVLENNDTFAGYYYIRLSGAVAGNADNTNRPILIKLVAKEGYESATLAGGETFKIDVSDENGNFYWFNGPALTFKDGVASCVVDACLQNRLNGAGSLRIGMDNMAKISRIEVYDAATACQNPNLSAADLADVHKAMYAANYNVTVEGAVEATDKAQGFTGKVTCDLCGAVITEGEYFYKEPYAWFDASSGVLSSNRVMGPQGGLGSTTPVQIPGTDEYGLRLDEDWSGFWIGGNLLADVPEGQSVTMVVKYHATQASPTAHDQVFRYMLNDNPQVDLFSDDWGMASGKTGLIWHTFTAEEMAQFGTGDIRFKVMGCNAGAGKIYVQGAKLISTDFVEAPVAEELTYIDLVGQQVTPYFPEVTLEVSNNVSYLNAEQHADHPDKEWLYRYFKVFGDVRAADLVTNKPVYIKLYAAEGFENATVSLGAFEVSDGVNPATWSHNVGYEAPVINFVDGVGGAYLPAACFNNGLNGVGSVRIWCDDAVKISRIEFYDVATACNGNMTDGVKDAIHAGMIANGQNIVEEGNKIFCGTCGDEISAPVVDECEHLEVIVIDAKDATCGDAGYTGDTVCAACGELIKEGEEIPATGDHVWDDGVVTIDPTCDMLGEMTYTCTGCGEFYTEEVPMTDHTPGELLFAYEADCANEGYTGDAYCDICGNQVVFGEVIPKLPHTWDDGVITTQPTTEATGVKTYTCTVCGETKTEVLPMLAKEYTYKIADGAVTITKVSTAISGDVVIPDTIEGYPVTTIGSNAFKGCVNITSLTIPASITKITEYAFRGCTALTTVYFNAANCTLMGAATYQAFKECTALTTVYVGKEVTQIPANAFRDVPTLTALYMTKNTKKINVNAFHNTGLLDVYYVGSASDWTSVSVSSYNNILDTAVFSYNFPCFQDHDWTADCDALCDLCNLKRVTTHAN